MGLKSHSPSHFYDLLVVVVLSNRDGRNRHEENKIVEELSGNIVVAMCNYKATLMSSLSVSGLRSRTSFMAAVMTCSCVHLRNFWRDAGNAPVSSLYFDFCGPILCFHHKQLAEYLLLIVDNCLTLTRILIKDSD